MFMSAVFPSVGLVYPTKAVGWNG